MYYNYRIINSERQARYDGFCVMSEFVAIVHEMSNFVRLQHGSLRAP
jgi:hypothetical protein